MKRVVLTATVSSTYDFFLPIAIEVWRKRIGYEPLVYLVGHPEDWQRGHRKVVFDKVVRMMDRIEWVGSIIGIPDAVIAMSIRQHAPALSRLDPSDLFLIGDVDLLPIRKEFYNWNDRSRELTIFHSNMYNDRYWPAYGPAMSVASWREVMGLVVGDPVGSMMKTFVEANIPELVRSQSEDALESRLWTFDETNASRKIRESRFGEKFLRINSYGYERLCRNSWPYETPIAENYVDCHCPRPGWTDQCWPMIRGILDQILPESLHWIGSYVYEYRQSKPNLADPFE